MPIPNINKSPAFFLSKVISDIYIFRKINGVYEQPAANFVLIEKGSVKLRATPKIVEMVDGSEYQLGYDFEFEITSLQYYSLYEFEHFKNYACLINLHPLHTYIKDVVSNITLDAEPGSVKGQIKISSKKFIEKLRDAVDGNPWGTLPSPPYTHEIPRDTIQLEGFTPSLDFGYTYIMKQHDPLIINFDPNPPVNNRSAKFDLVLVDNIHNQLAGQKPEAVTLKIRVNNTWTTMSDQDDLEMKNGLWVVKYNQSGEDPVYVYFGDIIRVEYSMKV